MTPIDDLTRIYTAGIKAVDPRNAVLNHLIREEKTLTLLDRGEPVRVYNLDDYKRIIVVGAGKATAPMAAAAEQLLGDRIDTGCVAVKYGYTTDLSRIEMIEASHPIPDEEGMKGASRIVDILKKADKDDLVISLISGGGSALLPLPPGSITLDEKRTTTDLLLKCGATIHEINAVRKHLSMVKGGNLARAAFPATVINCMISDVVGDDTDVIASGPFVADNSTFMDAKRIFEKYKLTGEVPAAVLDYIDRGARGEIEDNPKSNSKIFNNINNQIIASNIIALMDAKKEAENLGYNSIILSSLIEGDTGDVAIWHSRIAREIFTTSHPVAPPACVISGGETTVKVRGDGLGGRSMEFAIQSALQIQGLESVVMASVGTDGTDGPTDAAGAFAGGSTVSEAAEMGINIQEYIDNSDSYHFFKKTGALIVTGPTNTNVMDMRFILVK